MVISLQNQKPENNEILIVLWTVSWKILRKSNQIKMASQLFRERQRRILSSSCWKYSVRTRRNNRTYWRCVDRQCPATVVTLDNILVSFGRPHNHEGDFIALAARTTVCAHTWNLDDWLWDGSQKCSRRDISKYDNSRLFFPLHSVSGGNFKTAVWPQSFEKMRSSTD